MNPLLPSTTAMPADVTSQPGANWRKWILLGVMGVAAIVVASLSDVRALLRDALDWIEQLGPWGPILFVLIYVVATVLLVPGSALTLGAGAVFGVVRGTLIVSLASTLAATAAFLVGRYLARDAIARKIERNEKFAAIDKAVADEGWKIVLLTRLSPVFPFSLLNYAFGLTRVRLSHYVLASWIGMLPGTVMYGNDSAPGPDRRGRADAHARRVGALRCGLARDGRDHRFRDSPGSQCAGATRPSEGRAMNRAPLVQPWDQHNRELVANVHPPDWTNPAPASRYNLVVIGAGTAGLVTAVGAAGLGAKVALVEKHLMGGDCLNVGCVPSKALIRSARAAAEVRRAAEFGVDVSEGVRVDFSKVMERLRQLRASISPHDSAARFRNLGVDVFLGTARFTGPETIEVGGQTLRFAKAVIATGARAAVPATLGLNGVPHLTNETLFSLTELPKRFGVIGAGPIGCEMAQTFARFGSQVFLVEAAHGILPREDRDAAEIVQAALVRDGVKLLCCGKDLLVSKERDDIRLKVESHGQGYDVLVDQLLVAVGRAPNVEGLGLETVGVEFDRKGVKVNDRLRTTNPRIFACGDICSPYQFTHSADFMARIVIQNALFKGRARASSLIIPWCTYTSPEIAHVGLYEKDANEKSVEVDTFTQEMRTVDRAILDGEPEGFVRVHIRKGTDAIVGATIVAAHAGDLIGEVTLAMKGQLGLKTIAGTIHPYPTHAEAIRKTGFPFNRARLPPAVKKSWDAGWPGNGEEAAGPFFDSQFLPTGDT